MLKDDHAASETILASDMNKQAAAVNAHRGVKNALINGRFDIWQRGTSFASPASGAYTADRWKVTYDGSGATRTISQQTFTLGNEIAGQEGRYYCRFAQSVGGSGGTVNRLAQLIESVRTFAGQDVTLSFWAKAAAATSITARLSQVFGTGGSPSATVDTTAGSPSLTTSWQKFSYPVTVPSISGKTLGTAGDDALAVSFDMPNNATFTVDIWGVQLEAGDTDTNLEQRPIAVELAMCQRYYEKSFALTIAPFDNPGYSAAFSDAGIGVCQATTQVKGVILFKVEKRAVPTLTFYNAQGGGAGAGTWSGYDGTDRLGLTVSYTAYEPRFAVTLTGSGMTVGRAMLMIGNWTASAEL